KKGTAAPSPNPEPEPEKQPMRGATEFAAKNGMFTMKMPAGESGGAQAQVLTIRSRRIPVEASQSVTKEGLRGRGASVGIPAVIMREIPADERFDILRDALMKQFTGKVVEEKDIKEDVVVGKEYQIELEKGAARMQLYTVTGFVVYAI